MKISNSDLCTFCSEEPETIEHIFWECDNIQPFWENMLRVLQSKCTHLDNLNLCEELVLLGHVRGFKSDDILDQILLLAKHFIYTCRFNHTLPNCNAFLKLLYTRYCIDNYLCKMDEGREDFRQKWQPYMNLFDNLNDT